MAYAVRNLETLVQVPPRGLWGMQASRGTRSPPTGWPARMRLAQPRRTPCPAAMPSRAARAMIFRYLAAFGPATVMDVQAWAGVTRLAEVIEPLRSELRTYHDENGRELWDLPEAAWPP